MEKFCCRAKKEGGTKKRGGNQRSSGGTVKFERKGKKDKGGGKRKTKQTHFPETLWKRMTQVECIY